MMTTLTHDAVTVDLLGPDAFTVLHGHVAADEEDARTYARAFLARRMDAGLPAFARVHLPDQYGRPNARLVLMGPNPTDEREED